MQHAKPTELNMKFMWERTSSNLEKHLHYITGVLFNSENNDMEIVSNVNQIQLHDNIPTGTHGLKSKDDISKTFFDCYGWTVERKATI